MNDSKFYNIATKKNRISQFEEYSRPHNQDISVFSPTKKVCSVEKSPQEEMAFIFIPPESPTSESSHRPKLTTPPNEYEKEELVYDDPILKEMFESGMLDSYGKFLTELFEKVNRDEEEALRSISHCSSNKSETYSIFRGLNEEFKQYNFDTFTDPNGKKIDLVELFIIRYRQINKDRALFTSNTDIVNTFWNLKDYHLENNSKIQRRKNITDFDRIFKY